MTYEVYLDPQVIHFLRKCNRGLAKRLGRKLKLLEENPFIYLEHLERRGFYKYRIGDYRAIIDIEEQIIYVRYINHRSKVYKRFKG